jgi:hypothetical protein
MQQHRDKKKHPAAAFLILRCALGEGATLESKRSPATPMETPREEYDVLLDVSALGIAATVLAQRADSSDAGGLLWQEVSKSAGRLWGAPDRARADLQVWGAWPLEIAALVKSIVCLLRLSFGAESVPSEVHPTLLGLLTLLPLKRSSAEVLADAAGVLETIVTTHVAGMTSDVAAPGRRLRDLDVVDSALLLLNKNVMVPHWVEKPQNFVDELCTGAFSLENCRRLLDDAGRSSEASLRRSIFHGACLSLRRLQSGARLDAAAQVARPGLEYIIRAALLESRWHWAEPFKAESAVDVVALSALHLHLLLFPPRSDVETLVADDKALQRVAVRLVAHLWGVLDDYEASGREVEIDNWRFSSCSMATLALLAHRRGASGLAAVRGSGALLVLRRLSQLPRSGDPDKSTAVDVCAAEALQQLFDACEDRSLDDALAR